MSAQRNEALQGALDLLVLNTLSRGALHGYGIIARLQEVSDDILRVEEGSLYPALHRMEQAGWISAEWQMTPEKRRVRMYQLTRIGKRRLSEKQEQWNRLTIAIDKALRFA